MTHPFCFLLYLQHYISTLCLMILREKHPKKTHFFWKTLYYSIRTFQILHFRKLLLMKIPLPEQVLRGVPGKINNQTDKAICRGRSPTKVGIGQFNAAQMYGKYVGIIFKYESYSCITKILLCINDNKLFFTFHPFFRCVASLPVTLSLTH